MTCCFPASPPTSIARALSSRATVRGYYKEHNIKMIVLEPHDSQCVTYTEFNGLDGDDHETGYASKRRYCRRIVRQSMTYSKKHAGIHKCFSPFPLDQDQCIIFSSRFTPDKRLFVMANTFHKSQHLRYLHDKLVIERTLITY